MHGAAQGRGDEHVDAGGVGEEDREEEGLFAPEGREGGIVDCKHVFFGEVVPAFGVADAMQDWGHVGGREEQRE